MKVTAVTAFPVHPGWRKNLIFVKIETDEGITGWGEAYSQYDRDRSITAHIEMLGKYLVGRDPFQIKYFTSIAYDDYAQRRSSLEYFCALSGIEAALWDIVGKACGQPVYNLLGGACRESVRVYANGWSYKMKDVNDFVRAAENTVALGFDALKFDPFPRPWRTFIPREHIHHAVNVVRSIRKAVGPKVDLLIELHRRLAPAFAVEFADRIMEFEPYLIEEPCPAENMEAIAEVRHKIKSPVMTGENIFSKAGFRRVFEHHAADFINPDVANCGGILELKEIAAMAEPYLVGVSPHNYNSTSLALSATVHAAATMPNFLITEYFIPFVEFCDILFPEGQLKPVNGRIALPTGPGLGLVPDEKALIQHAAKPFPLRKLPYPADEWL
ncbi:mandelate racemase/muconate lactonizing enzyme family protein [Mailhella sp.]|uniref:mandelate racemase/muconate lactonizing enzyme family protein n=1 Tax=Mailhella sp. TaxID=1981029 RepID=UPI003AB2B587